MSSCVHDPGTVSSRNDYLSRLSSDREKCVCSRTPDTWQYVPSCSYEKFVVQISPGFQCSEAEKSVGKMGEESEGPKRFSVPESASKQKC